MTSYFEVVPASKGKKPMEGANTNQSQQQKYQVTIHFQMDEEFMTLVPPHRTYINYLINKGIVDSYTVSLESMRSWIVMSGTSKKRGVADIGKIAISKVLEH